MDHLDPLSEEHHLRQRRAVWIGLVAAIIMGTASQLCWKAATQYVPANAGTWETIFVTFHQPLFLVALALFILQFFNWMVVLSKADLSYAQPITAASYVSVSAMAWILFGEQIPLRRMVGIGLILLGVWFISRTSHRTAPRKHHAKAAPEKVEVPL